VLDAGRLGDYFVEAADQLAKAVIPVETLWSDSDM
jgi:hypothetical protein